mmetsp:Transcript_31513/g.52587  ORF Transcript_31513/g.52587 Transcript_31513/m.52587 type:complete len:461 (+) Transcript_31513:338-1720(+)
MLEGYHRRPCSRFVAKQFQFPDCYVPGMAESLPLSQASFVMSHDAATGYLPQTTVYAAMNSYGKNQIGTVYQQLNDGARALDVRPKLLANGTVVCHHGAVSIPVTLNQLVRDAIRWCQDNPEELVLIFHSNLAYPSQGNDDDSSEGYTPSAETALSVLSQVYESLKVAYVQCQDVYGLTVGETMQLAALSGGKGYLLAMDRQDAYASSCAKANYVGDLLVSCYTNTTTSSSRSSSTLPCTNPQSSLHQALQDYVLASANNEPTDSNSELGPPASTYYYPFNELQALWQVDGISAALGIAHVSTLIDDNTKSKVNAHVVEWIYDGLFDSISLLAVDHVRLNGNALLSVLRNQCGQSELSSAWSSYQEDRDNADNYQPNNVNDSVCGRDLSKPKVQGKPMSTLSFLLSVVVFVAFGIWILILLEHYRRYYNHQEQLRRMEVDLNQFGCGVECEEDYSLPNID